MSGLDAISVQVEQATGNVLPLLHEVRHALSQLLESGTNTTIDLGSIPLAPGEDERIEETLGKGEVLAELEAIGPSTIAETAFPGVWLVTHCNASGEPVGRFIEITFIPAILCSQVQDIEDGRNRLRALLDSPTGSDVPTVANAGELG